MQRRASGEQPERVAALEQYRRRAARYDLEVAVFEPVRAQAIEALRLQPGWTVIDVGCGTGLSFAPLRECIGAGGRIVAIDQSPEMIARARQRIAREHWPNVHVVCAPAASAALRVQADAALFHLTHDILRDDAALAHVLSHLRPGAHVVASGLRWTAPWWWPTNAFVMAAALYSTTSLEGLGRSWDKLARRLRQVEVRSTLLGGMFIASGIFAPQLH